jgi:anti-sigma factor RsiW
MNHPKPEEWVPYVYGEATSTMRRELAAHLQDCPRCRTEIETWKRSLSRLDAWKLPRVQPPSELLVPLLKWAVAAAVVLAVGISIGRATAPKVDVEKLRLALAPQLERDLSREMVQLVRQEVVRTTSLTLASDRRYADQVAAEYAQQIYVVLKKDLDTVALNADAGLRNTEQQLFQLADYKEPENPATPNQ